MFSHIINPVRVGENSDLHKAQPITFETMKTACEYPGNEGDVKLYTAQFEEDSGIIPDYFIKTENLERSVLDIESFNIDRKLPLLKDILDRLYSSSNDEYMIYTNADIALMPNFYQSAAKIINNGYDAFIVNRRTISSSYKGVEDIPLMYAEVGEKHKGWDCFVFKRELYKKFDLGLGIIGQGWIGRILLSNMVLHANNFRIFEELHLTFHIGNDKSWKNDKFRDYQVHNIRECKRILVEYEEKHGKLDRDSIPGNFYNLELDIY